jgi:sugar phosphate isomerase/epimerase
MGAPAPIPVGLSTASVWPESAAAGFRLAAELGFDGVEVMVWADPESQSVATLRKLATRYGMPVVAVHAPCLLVSQRVWSHDPAIRLEMAAEAAQDLGAHTVVVHPPFVWQPRYAARFGDLIGELESRTGVAVAVENMFPVRPLRPARSVAVSPFWPSADPTEAECAHYTLDLSHTSTAQTDPCALSETMGERLAHVHLADGNGSSRDEHLLPGRGAVPCAEVLAGLVSRGFPGHVVLEVSTRTSSRTRRTRELTEAVHFARRHLAAPGNVPSSR